MRKRMVFLVAVLVIMMSSLRVEWYMERDVITGNQGPFPAALGTEAPAAPSQVSRQSYRPEALVHGLSIVPTDSGVRALNLRTGKEYWRYERRDEGADMPSVEVSAGTVVAWFDDGKLVGIDLRTGNVRWRTEFSRGGFQDIHMGAGQVVAQTPGGVAAFSERSGKKLWTLRLPRSCKYPWAVHDLPNHLTAVELGCESSDDQNCVVIGVDNRTGAELWKRTVRQEVYKTDNHTLVAVSPITTSELGEMARVQVLDVDRKGARLRAEFSSDSWSPDDAGDGIIISAAIPESPGSVGAPVLTGYDTQVGKRAWERQAPPGHSFGFAKCADGRVYVVQNSLFYEGGASRVLHADLLVLDAHSGDLLHRLRLPDMTVPRDFFLTDLTVSEAGDGVIRVRWPEALHDELFVT
ncbi:outer membrane protein assembly factor BamB family protein [Streptomyces sp. NBC_00208]|uniref:outer membrane protein assembly factor BamB family protein n=1 Tax=Streptomyces sp. NBC_00208 TaxID=2975681 RepID=UPI002E2A9251|nr:PQQ-binding-like beta-propeller repeat protein [Streptomyces sp. NBC_00208]